MRGSPVAEDPQIQVLAERHPPLRARIAVRIVLAEPPQLGGQIRSVKDAAGPRVRRDRVELTAQLCRGAAGSGVGPGEDARGRAAVRANADQAVPERRCGHGRDIAGTATRARDHGVDDAARRTHALLGIDGGLAVGGDAHRPVGVGDERRDRPSTHVEQEDTQPRRADVEGEHERRARLAQRDRERLAQHGASMRAVRRALSG